jgi:type I restriction enzyme S subunit
MTALIPQSLGEVISISKGKKHELTDTPSSSSKRLIGIDDLRNDDLLRYTDDVSGTESNLDDVLIAWDGANAGTIGFGKAGYIGSTIARLRVKPGVRLHTPFLGLYLRSKFDYLRQTATGATIPHVSRGALESISLPNVAFDDQIRIAHLLGKVETLIAQRKQHLQQLDDLLKSVFLEMFGDPVRNEMGWETKALPEVCKKITDGEHLNPTFSPIGMPMVMAGNVLDNTVNLEDTKFVEHSLGESFRKKCNPELSDILLVSRGATIGRLCRVDTSAPFCLMGSVILLKPVHAAVNVEFLVAQLKHPALYWKLFKSSGSSAQQAIYLKDVKRLVCIIPPMDQQLKFSNFSKKIESVKEVYRSSLVELEALYGALSQQAFKGRLNLSLIEMLNG